jgi:chemotaxis protein histidine kinase CheA
MTEQTASRTLVKSPPELWAEVSDPGSLARHLGEFGEIRITRLEGESTVAWEGERASGTVEIAPSGWGTKVTLTAMATEPEAGAAEPDAVAEPEAEAPEPAVVAAVAAAVEPEAEAQAEAVAAEPEAQPEAVAAEPEAQPEAEPEAPPPATERRGFFARLFARWRRPAEPEGARPDPFAGVTKPETAVPEAAAPEAAAPQAAEPQAAAPEPADPQAVAPQAAAPEPADPEAPQTATLAVLTAALDSLGQAHHRPFSRG